MRSITGYILSKDFVVEELEGKGSDIEGKGKDIIICYARKNLINRFRLWLSQKIRPEIIAIIPINSVSDDEAGLSLISPPDSQVIPLPEYEQMLLDNAGENKELLIQEDICQEELD